MKDNKFSIGWAQVDITPEKSVCLCGQFHARVSEGIKDPITSTIVVFESKNNGMSQYAVMISCDLVAIPDEFRKAIISKLNKLVPEIDEKRIIISATHTHTAPEVGGDILRGTKGLNIKDIYGIDLPVMSIADYIDFASSILAEGIKDAWSKRQPGAIGYGLGFAVVGFNRRASYLDGSSRMYGKTDDEQFSHIEGYEDHSLNILATYDSEKKLTGLIVNIACPSQVDEGLFVISADYWHQVRQELRKRFGEKIFVLPQCSAAGDQSPHVLLCKQTYQRMLDLSGKSERQDIALRIADGIQRILPDIEKHIDDNPVICCVSKTINLKRFQISRQELDKFIEESKRAYAEYEKLKNEIESNPEKKKEPRWYRDITFHFRKYRWFDACKTKFELQEGSVPVEIYVLRIGDIVFATNPFELFLDYGIRIKARSRAVQTFVVQLAGGGTYLPTERAIKGGSYGAIAPSCMIGPEGGNQLVEETLNTIHSLW
jgi:hypothetical protein